MASLVNSGIVFWTHTWCGTGSHNQFTIGILYESVCFANVVIRKAILEQGTSVTGQNIVIRTIVPQYSIQYFPLKGKIENT